MSINMSVTDAKCAPLALLIVGLTLLGCESLRAYDGPKRADSDLAHIVGDSRVAGVPLAVILRQVDGADLGVRYNSVKVLPGAHSLLIDCTVTESKQTSRHHLDVDVDADVHYRLVANTGPGNRVCEDVQLVPVN
jgi:hypothetical protein